MEIIDRIRDALEKGVEISRDLVAKASEGARELGEKGVLRMEILQLESELKNSLGKLGGLVYEQMIKNDEEGIRRDDEVVQTHLKNIIALEKDIKSREERIKEIDQ